MTAPIPEAEAFIRFRLDEMASRNEHHRFEEVATRIARKRISSNLLIATGPVSSGGDQQRDAESYTTRIPDELPHSAGFAAAASTEPVVIACTVQREGLKSKVLADLAGICSPRSAPVSHVAYFSVHPIAEGTTHELQRTARETYGVGLDVFCGTDIAMFLAEPDLVWVARHYLELPSSLVPPPEDDAAPQWYAELLENLRQNNGPAALTPATQGEVTEGMRFATWDEVANADLPEWLDFMGAFLADTEDGKDTDLVFRACYEMAVARFRGMGVASGIEDLVRRAIAYASMSSHPNVVDDAVTLTSYWGVMWTTGVARAEASEIAAALDQLLTHVTNLLDETDPSSYPVRAASLTGTLAFAYLLPDWRKIEHERGQPETAVVAPNVGVKFDEFEVDVSALDEADLVDVDTAMQYLDQLVDLLPRARAYSASQLARVFTMFAPMASRHPSYVKVRDGLDATLAEAEGDAALASRCRDRGMAFMRAGRPLEALAELHNAKAKWFNGDTLYGAVLTMRVIGKLYADLGLVYAAKMYACTATALAMSHGDSDLKAHVPQALLDAARYADRAGCLADAAGLTEIAMLARAQFLTEPFDFDRYPDLDGHRITAALQLSAVRKFWPELEAFIAPTPDKTGWFTMLDEFVEASDAEYQMSEDQFQHAAAEQLDGPLFSDLGPTRIIDFEALGVRWVFTFGNDRTTVLTVEGFCAVLQVILADIALLQPVLINSTVHVDVDVRNGVDHDVDMIDIDDARPEILAHAILSDDMEDVDAWSRSLLAMCFQLLHAVHVRPPDDLQAMIEPLFKNGLPHKAFIGRPYEEAAGLLDQAHYSSCAAAARPGSSSLFRPTAADAIAASTAVGAGYDHTEAMQAIRERYEVANETLRYTLPRVLTDEAGRVTLVRLRDAGWLDWQILVVLVNQAWNWRMRRAGIGLGVGDPSQAMHLAREPETPQSPVIPIETFTNDVDMHTLMQTVTVARRWDLRGRQEAPGEEAMRDLLTRRYQYAVDDVPHRDLLNCLGDDGSLLPLLDDSSGSA